MTTSIIVSPLGSAMVSEDGAWKSDDDVLVKFLEATCPRTSWMPRFGNPVAWMGRRAASLIGGELVVRGNVAVPRGKSMEAFCPTGDGGGVDNSCGSGDRPTTSGRTSQPKGFRSLDDAIKLAGLDSETRDKSKSDTKPSEPKIRTVVRNESEVNDWLQRLDISKVDRQVLSQSAGALEGSTVVMMGGRGGVHMEVHDDRYRAVTSVQRSAEGDLYLENWNFQVFPHERGQGLGTEIIKTQIDAAHQMGARGIVVHSIGDWKRRETHNGYYTWPRMGFDGDLPRDWQSRMMATGLAEIPEQFSQASRVSDFFKKPEGRELWKRHGFPMELAFDVQPGSLSRKVFDNYYSAQTRRQAEIKQEEDDTEQARAERWRRMDAAMREFDAKAGESAVTKPPENHNSFDIGVDDDESVYGAAWDALSGLATESSSGNLVPPESVRSNAKRGLELRAKNGGKGGTIVGVARARDLSNGSSISPRTIGRMVSFFARHQGNQEGGEQDEGYIAWLLWGGDAGKRWANARWEEIQGNRGIASESLDSGDNCGTGDGGFQPGNTCASSGGGSSKPTKKEKQALQDYSTDKFVEINGQLRSGKLSKEIAAMTGLIDSALEKMPKREGATVRSFTVGSDEEFAKISAMLKEGGVFTDASYMSTRKTPTLSDKVAFSTKTSGNRHVVMRVEGKSGVDISDISLNPGEGEVLYPRGTRFKVNKVIATKGGGLLAVVSEIQGNRGIASESLDSGDNCGTGAGAGGFQPGNECAKGGGGELTKTKATPTVKQAKKNSKNKPSKKNPNPIAAAKSIKKPSVDDEYEDQNDSNPSTGSRNYEARRAQGWVEGAATYSSEEPHHVNDNGSWTYVTMHNAKLEKKLTGIIEGTGKFGDRVEGLTIRWSEDDGFSLMRSVGGMEESIKIPNRVIKEWNGTIDLGGGEFEDDQAIIELQEKPLYPDRPGHGD